MKCHLAIPLAPSFFLEACNGVLASGKHPVVRLKSAVLTDSFIKGQASKLFSYYSYVLLVVGEASLAADLVASWEPIREAALAANLIAASRTVGVRSCWVFKEHVMSTATNNNPAAFPTKQITSCQISFNMLEDRRPD